ncbi:MAG: metallophosphoesterase [Proteobacteria bacterium]|nr:metallophosphoesterase [Pseudomonadota bacterium]MDA0993333.1 metallophosphoesterase [Pseudomonadota bacterium]
MKKIRRISLQVLACLLLPVLLSACALAEQYRWTGVERVVAMSDPHGAYDAMVRTLTNAGVIDEEFSWSGGETHLVITGDLLDRGADSRRIMDLVMKLESEASAKGGMVHLTLGNHEVMNLVGDVRYVSRGEYAAFSDEESADEREAWFQRYRAAMALEREPVPDEDALRATFNEARPPGFYGHRQAFGSEGKYGRWLLQKPLVVVVNDTAFVHAGLPPMVADFTLEQLNNELGSQVGDYLRHLEVLNRAGLIDPATGFYDHVNIAEQLAADPAVADEIRVASLKVVELNDAAVHDPNGPIWYRGTVSCSVLSEGDVLAASLAALGANRLVIGHTPTVTRQVLQRFGGRVIEIDTGMLKSSYNGSGNALVIEGDSVSVVHENGSGSTLPIPHPRRVGRRSESLSDENLESLLSSGQISSTATDASGRTIVKLTSGNDMVQAIFTKGPRGKGPNTELAAYRLDRLLQLNMIPITVVREVDGKQGTLQFLPDNIQTEAIRAVNGRGGSANCPLPRQWNSLYVFDALVYNDSRTPNSMIYDTGDWQLMSIGHPDTFGTRRGRPAYLATIPLEITGAWVEALSSLSDEVLAANFADVLDEKRINALATRRDLLIEQAAQ